MNIFFHFNGFFLGVGVNFKPLIRILTCVSVWHVLDKLMTLGWIIVYLFDWCGLPAVLETKNYLRLRHLIVDLHLSLVWGTITVWLCHLCSVSSFLIGSITTTSNVLFLTCFEGQLNLPILCLFSLSLCWFLNSAGVGYSSTLSFFGSWTNYFSCFIKVCKLQFFTRKGGSLLIFLHLFIWLYCQYMYV